ncbi:hypothetical protein [Bacillus vallismortis]|nr:hypothetical protein [Bacillus vallismortis]MEC1268401.1 hypothetical protein [Bacillus vallismortis]
MTGYFAIRKYLSGLPFARQKFSRRTFGSGWNSSRHIGEADLLLILLKNK